MRALTVCSFFFFSCFTLWAQLPPNQPEQDCYNAIPLCQDIYVQTNSYQGAGRDTDEINGAISCMLLGERNSVWYTFRAATAGELCFTIIPVDTMDDYDWAVFDITGRNCYDIRNNINMAAACNYTYNTGCAGETGANGRTDCPGQFEACLQVFPGQRFVLNVSNFTSSNQGYTIDFSQSSARLYDDIPPEITEMESFCSGVRVHFSENVDCSSIDVSDFTFTGPGGPYTISELRGPCATNGFTPWVDLLIDPAITDAGTYSVALTGSIGDLCGNVAPPVTFEVFMPKPPVASITATLNPNAASNCELENQWIFEYTGPTDVVTYDWQFGDGNSSFFPNPVHHYDTYGDLTTQLVITDQNGCQDSATTTVTVLPKPTAGIFVTEDACQGNTVSLISTASPRGGSEITRYEWQVGDSIFTTADASYTFLDTGKYFVNFSVWNDLNCRDTLIHWIDVHPKPKADFQPDEAVCVGDDALMFSLASVDGQAGLDSLVAWQWNFGDSSALDVAVNPRHRFMTGDTFSVQLQVRTNYGCVDSISLPQIVYDPVPPIILADTVCYGDSAHLIAVAAPAGTIRWYASLQANDPFATTPSITVGPVVATQAYYLTQELKQGCLSDRILVEAATFGLQGVQILADPPVVSFPDPTVQFELVGDIQLDSVQWAFTNLDTVYEVSPAYTFSRPGAHVVTAAIVDTHGCHYQASIAIEVEAIPGVYAPTAFSPNADGINDEWYVSTQLMQSLELTILNRQGRVLASSSNPDFRWNGRGPNGQDLPEGVYVYRLTGLNTMGTQVTHSGAFTLFR